MASVVKQFGFNGTTEAERKDENRWAFAAEGAAGIEGATLSKAEDSTNDSGSNPGVAKIERAGKSLTNGAPYWEWTGTWQQLGVPAGATVTAVNLSYDWRCIFYSTGASSTVGPAELRSEAGSLRATFSSALAYSAESSWATRSGANQTGLSDPASTKIKLRLNAVPKTGASSSADNNLYLDWVVVTVEYEEPGVAGPRPGSRSLLGVGR